MEKSDQNAFQKFFLFFHILKKVKMSKNRANLNIFDV